MQILHQIEVICSPEFTSMNGTDTLGSVRSVTDKYGAVKTRSRPNSARFTTIDLIRDGSNWFSYVVNDPINYIDPFGLTPFDVKRPNIELINSTIKPILYLACRVFNIIQFYAKFCIESEINVKNLYLYAKFY